MFTKLEEYHISVQDSLFHNHNFITRFCSSIYSRSWSWSSHTVTLARRWLRLKKKKLDSAVAYFFTLRENNSQTRRHHLNIFKETEALMYPWKTGWHVVECQTVNRRDCGSIRPTAILKRRQFHSPHICLCLSEETLKAGGLFYLVSMTWRIKDPTQGVNV